MVQLGNRDVNTGRGSHLRAGLSLLGDRTSPEPPDSGHDVIGVQRRLPAPGDRLLNHLHRVFGQELQDPDILPRAGGEPFPLFEGGPQLLEAGRQFPFGKHDGVIQGGRPATENRQMCFPDPLTP